ncbi:MAG: HEAT repeat domain-containing protein [Chloroflexi bacterium]|nr:HEAT repeat domain-containing protein [Chloroflexota bacterium]
METVVLKADLEGSCRLKERKGDDTANPIISEVCDELLKIISAYTEDCEAGAGDSIIAFFDSADKAIQASIEMQEHLAERAQIADRPESPDKLLFSIALHSGDIKEMGETPLKTKGRAIDFTSRLEGLVDGGQVFVSKALKDGVSPELVKKLDGVYGEGEAFHSYGDFEWEHFDETEVFELLWHKGQEPKFGLFKKYAEKVRKDWEKEKKLPKYLGDNEYIEPGLRKKFREPIGTNPDEYKPLKIKDLLREKRASIVADSGMGKSLLLKELQMRVDDDRTPILFHFRELDHVSTRDELYERIYDALYSLGFPKGLNVENTIKGWAGDNRFIFLIDGFDQVGTLNNYEKLLGRNSIFDGNTVIFTTRPWKYNMFESELSLEENYSRIELDKFSDRQVRLYLGGSYNRIASLFKGRRDLVGEPIILSLALELFNDTDNKIRPINIENRTDLYDHLMDRLLKREREIGGTAGIKLDDTRLRERFKEIAFEATARGFLGAFPKSIIGELYPHISDDDYCNLLERGILCELWEGTAEKEERDFVEFRHQSFQEFLAALKMKELFDEGKFRLREYAEYLIWDDTLIFLSGLLKDKAKPLIEEALKYDPLLAAKMWGESKTWDEKLKKDMINSAKNADISIFSALSEMGDLNGLLKLLEDEDKNVRSSAVDALGKIGSEKAVEPLIRLLEDENEYVRRSAVDALGKIGSEKAVEPLIRLLKDESVRWHAVVALRKIGFEKTAEPMIRLLKNKNEDIDARLAALALNMTVSGKAGKPHILLKDEGVHSQLLEKALKPSFILFADEGVHWSAVYALDEIGSEEDVEPLMRQLEDKDEFARREVANALGWIVSKTNDLKKQSDIYSNIYKKIESWEGQEIHGKRYFLNRIEKAAGRRFLDIKFPETPSAEK